MIIRDGLDIEVLLVWGFSLNGVFLINVID